VLNSIKNEKKIENVIPGRHIANGIKLCLHAGKLCMRNKRY
jgi:hypothetical protein